MRAERKGPGDFKPLLNSRVDEGQRPEVRASLEHCCESRCAAWPDLEYIVEGKVRYVD
jgi:hypothetical protein